MQNTWPNATTEWASMTWESHRCGEHCGDEHAPMCWPTLTGPAERLHGLLSRTALLKCLTSAEHASHETRQMRDATRSPRTACTDA